MQKTDPKTKRIAIAIGAAVALLIVGVVVFALVQHHRITQVPDHFPRAEPRASTARAPWPPRFGVNANLVAEQGNGVFRLHQFRAIAAGGLGWIRINIAWPWLQSARDAPLDFGRIDPVVRDAALAGLDMDAVLLFTPTWASTLGGSDRTPAKAPEDTDRFVRAVVARYRPGGAFWRANPALPARPIRVWEIWNEQNVRHFFAPFSAKTYAHHAVVVARAVRSADPRARIVFGGLAGHLDSSTNILAADEFLSDAVKAQPSLARVLDAVAIHSYGDAAEVADTTCKMRLTMDKLKMTGASLVLNEFGWNASGPGALSEPERARWFTEIVSAVVRRDTCSRPRRLVQIAPYTWWSPRADPDKPDQWFGLADNAATPFPSGAAYLRAAAAADRQHPRSQDR